jgi:hypothetical protein
MLPGVSISRRFLLRAPAGHSIATVTQRSSNSHECGNSQEVHDGTHDGASRGVAVAAAAVRIEIPEQGPGVPAYARIEAGRVIQDGAWAAIVFYRLPECVPQDFNLLRFFDPPRGFECR